MGEQLGFGFQDAEARREGYEVPEPRRRSPEADDPYPQGKLLAPNDEVTIIHRTGKTKRVRFSQVVGPRVYVTWPIANSELALSTKTGRVVVPRSLAEWKLEPNALEMARVARDMSRLEQKIAVE